MNVNNTTQELNDKLKQIDSILEDERKTFNMSINGKQEKIDQLNNDLEIYKNKLVLLQNDWDNDKTIQKNDIDQLNSQILHQNTVISQIKTINSENESKINNLIKEVGEYKSKESRNEDTNDDIDTLKKTTRR